MQILREQPGLQSAFFMKSTPKKRKTSDYKAHIFYVHVHVQDDDEEEITNSESSTRADGKIYDEYRFLRATSNQRQSQS